jgi:transcriptional antiterminator NusG
VASFKTYLSESYNELMNKVSWPTWKELQGSAIVVLVSALILSMVIFLMDYVFGVQNMGAMRPASGRAMLGFIYKFLILSEMAEVHQEVVRDPRHLRQGEEGEGDDRPGSITLQHGTYIAQVLIPMEKFYQIREGKKVSKERNFFPGYVLMEADLTGEIAHGIKNLPNVIGFLGAEKGGDPVPLRQSEVNRILGTVDDLADDEANHNPYHVGEGVKVIDGPFNGFNGVIEEINEEKKKLKVMVKIFGRKTPLELSFMQVEKEV